MCAPTYARAPFASIHLQDAIKKLTQQELPDFYNITLERPRDDPDGYDVLFVEAAFMVRIYIGRSHQTTCIYRGRSHQTTCNLRVCCLWRPRVHGAARGCGVCVGGGG